jgi:hypothetical protein
MIKIMRRFIPFIEVSLMIYVCVGCHHVNSPDPIDKSSSTNIADTTIYLNTLPMITRLSIGKSMNLEPIKTILTFDSVLYDSTQIVNDSIIGKAKIQMTADYGSFKKKFELGINEGPYGYYWEDGSDYVIYSEELKRYGFTYVITFTINEYAGL